MGVAVRIWIGDLAACLMVMPGAACPVEATAACDALAASPYDRAVPSGSGVLPAEIDGEPAIAACAAAVAKLRAELPAAGELV